MANRKQRRQAAKQMGVKMPENITLKQMIDRYNDAVQVMSRTVVPIIEVMTQTFREAQKHLESAGLLDEDGNLTETARRIMYNEEVKNDTDQTVSTSDEQAKSEKK